MLFYQNDRDVLLQLNDRVNTLTKQMKTVTNLLLQIIKGEQIMSMELDALVAEVSRTADIELSAVAMIKGLADQIADLRDDPVALVELTTKLHDSADALAAAIVANTPVVPPVVDPAVPVV